MVHVHASSSGLTLGKTAEIIFTLLLLLFGVLCIDSTVPEQINFMVIEYLDSTLYSQIVGCLLIITALSHMVTVWKTHTKSQSVPYTTLVGSVFTMLYVIGFTYIGFYISSFVFLAGYSLLIEEPEERHVTSKLVFAVFSVGMFFAVFKMFKIYLPPTWLV